MFKTQKQINENMVVSQDAAKLFGVLFQSRDITHLSHLAISSYASHIALNEYYDEIIELIDNLIESYQGIYGLVDITIPESKKVDLIPYLTGLHKVVQESKTLFTNDGNLLNKLDEIMDLISSTLYKLKELH